MNGFTLGGMFILAGAAALFGSPVLGFKVIMGGSVTMLLYEALRS